MTDTIQKIGVIGAGAWGTAMATAARRCGRDVIIHAHEPDVAATINETHVNEAFLPGIDLDPGIKATNDLAEAVDADAVLLVMPAQFLRAVTLDMSGLWKPGIPAVICCKGIEQETALLMSEVCAETLGGVPLAVLSGPTFAKEVAAGLPTAVTLACTDETLGKRLGEAIGSPRFRAYRCGDLIGTELGGAVKNVLAIACGVVEGRKLGDNARAALITRGLSEITRLAAAKGGQPETLMGLAGLGDLTLTCNAMQSRNFSLGVALGEGRSLSEILGERTSVAEGVHTASSVTGLARRLGIDAPICNAMDGILNHGLDIDAAIEGLLARPVGDEDPFGDGP